MGEATFYRGEEDSGLGGGKSSWPMVASWGF